MDRFGSFDRDDDQSGSTAYDDGVEAPPSIGTDERRMHVRAYNHWVSLLNGRAYPAIADLKPTELTDFGPNSVLLDFSGGGAAAPKIAYLGDRLQAECGLDDAIKSVADVPSRSLLSRLTDHYLQIIANRAPIGFEAEFVNERGNNTMYRGILMPFSSDEDSIDFIYGVINWKEVADEALTGAILDAVDRVLAEPVARVAEPVPVWADGPSAPLADAEPQSEADAAAYVADGSEGLGDWLAIARDHAEQALAAEGRSRGALYTALGYAHDFALAAEDAPDDFAELLEDSGIAVQDRAPMTPVVKLVFGVGYDKTRLAEYAAALTHAKAAGVARGAFAGYLETYKGGLKAVVAAAREVRRPAARSVAIDTKLDKIRAMEPIGIVGVPGDEEFVILVARRLDPDHVAVVGAARDDALLAKALRSLKLS